MAWTWKVICKEGIRPKVLPGVVIVLPEKILMACPGEGCDQRILFSNNSFGVCDEKVTDFDKPVECPNCGSFEIKNGETQWLQPQKT